MSTSIRINKLEYNINKASISEKYDFFSLETCEKYIKHGSYILDASALCNDIKAIKFESGKRVFIMMDKNSSNKSKIKDLIKAIDDGEYYSFLQQNPNDVDDSVIIQLLFNAIGSYESEMLKFNNLTGHLYCFHPNWIKRGKEKNQSAIMKVPSLELSVTKDLCLKLFVRTFTSSRLKNKITFKKKKFEDYPKYVFAANYTLRRKLKEDKEDCYILRQTDGMKSEITFLDIRSKDKFEQSKMGVLDNVIKTFNEKYSGICSIRFAEKTVDHRLDYSKAIQKENIKRIRMILSEKSIHIVDLISDEYSKFFCEEIKNLIKIKYDIEASIDKKVDKDGLNILLVHNKEYYEGTNDPHDKLYDGVAVQHITFEDFVDSSEFAISTVVHEIIIKKDLEEGKISLFDWEQLGLSGTVSFGIEKEINESKRYFFMNVNFDGTFSITEQEFTLFEMNEYTGLVDLFENAKSNNEVIKGVIRFENGSIATIKDTGLFTIPEIEAIGELLSKGDNKLRGKERREELLSSCLDIKSYSEKNADYYFVGTIGEGMRPNIQKGSVIRKIEGDTDVVGLDKILPLMNVPFVINGQLTAVPFPFKYLREYVCSL